MHLNMSRRYSAGSSQYQAFTLIEVLVVVAIIALLVSVLMPAMKSAKESSKATVCMSNMKQQGNGFMGYAKDNKSYLPYGGKFHYLIIDGWQRNIHWSDLGGIWNRQGSGLLFPKYTGNTPEIFYCPSGKAREDKDRGVKRFMYLYQNPRSGRYGDDPIAAMFDYSYGVPLAFGKSPREGVKYFYPDDSMEEVQKDDSDGGKSLYKPFTPARYSAFYSFLWDPYLKNNTALRGWLSPITPERTMNKPNGPRGSYPTQVLLTDGYTGGRQCYHVNGWNVLYSDFHAKRAGDASRKIDNDMGSSYVYPTNPQWTRSDGVTLGGCRSGKDAATWVAWDHFSRNP